MPRTPDRKPGPGRQEEIIYSPRTSDPTRDGAVRYVNGSFRMKDALGVFDPRTGNAPITTHHASVDVVLHFNDSILYGSVTGLAVPPSVVVPALGRDITSAVEDDDYLFTMEVLALNQDGFDYRVKVFDEGEPEAWKGGTITVRFDYIWGE